MNRASRSVCGIVNSILSCCILRLFEVKEDAHYIMYHRESSADGGLPAVVERLRWNVSHIEQGKDVLPSRGTRFGWY